MILVAIDPAARAEDLARRFPNAIVRVEGGDVTLALPVPGGASACCVLCSQDGSTTMLDVEDGSAALLCDGHAEDAWVCGFAEPA